MATSTDTAPATRRRKRRLGATLGVTVGAALAAWAVWLIAIPVAGFDVQVPQGASREIAPLGGTTVLLSALVGSLVALGLLLALERVLDRGLRVWTRLATLGVLLSLFGPLFTEDLATSTRVWLVLMHLVIGAVLIPGLRRTGPRA